jgi:predicted phage terminase large subunit-like protein
MHAPGQDLAALERELMRSLLRDSFADFAREFWPVVTGSPFVPNEVTTRVIAALQDVGDGKVTRLVLSKPPGCGASTLLVLFQSWRLARDPAWRTMAASHSYELAATASRRVRRLVTSPEFTALFRLSLREDAAQIALWETSAGGHYIAVGRDSNVTGRRVNEIVCDDLNAAADRYSKAALDHARVFFAETLSTRVDNDRAAMIVCAQRTAVDDVPGRLAEQGWTVVSVPAEDEHGNPLAPNVLPRERLDAIKAQIGTVAFICQYMQNPVSDETAFPVKRSWWRFHASNPSEFSLPRPAGCDTEMPTVPTPDCGRVVVACDLTFGESKAGDFAAVTAWGSYKGGRYLLEVWHKRAGFEAQVDASEAMASRYPGCSVIVEKAAAGAAAVETLRKRIPGVIAVKPRGAKAARLAILSPAAESGSLFLPIGMPGLETFVDELCGATKHDDLGDSAAYAIDHLSTREPPEMPCAGGMIGDDGSITFDISEIDLGPRTAYCGEAEPLDPSSPWNPRTLAELL